MAYDGVLRSHRQRYHARAAAWLSEVSGRSGREDEYAALIAEHYDRAGDPAAGAWYFRAGQQAMSVYALAEAAQLLRRALELVTDDPVVRFDVLATREAMHERVGDKDAQELDLTEMEELLGRFDDPARLVAYRIARSRLLFGVSRYDEAEEWAEQAADAAAEAGMPAEAAEAALWQGKSLVWHDEADAARAVLTRALDELRIADRPALVAEAQRYLSMLANNEGQYAEALDLVTRARDGFVAVGDLEGEGTALVQQATTLYNMNRIAEARATLEQVLPVFHRSGHTYREAIVVGNLATIAMSQGELAVARRWADEATAQTRALFDREATVNNLLVQGMIATAVGDWDAGEAACREALELARDVESRTHETDSLVRWAFLALEQEDHPRALQLAREADEVSEHAMSGMERGHARLVRGYAELANGHDAVAERVFAAAEEAYQGIELDVGEREARVGRAAVLLARQRVPDAVRLVEGVYDHLDRDGLAGTLRPTAVLDTSLARAVGRGRPARRRIPRAGADAGPGGLRHRRRPGDGGPVPQGAGERPACSGRRRRPADLGRPDRLAGQRRHRRRDGLRQHRPRGSPRPVGGSRRRGAGAASAGGTPRRPASRRPSPRRSRGSPAG